MNTPKDHFSTQAIAYSKYRPSYPKELYQYLSRIVKSHDFVWDCATGNGQAAVDLAESFSQVLATDPSAAQLRLAMHAPNIEYRCGSAENSEIASCSADLITVAQALHWFDHDRFFNEVDRILKPGGILATWCYQLLRIDPRVDTVITKFYIETIGPYWPPERKHIDNAYGSIAFPYKPLAVPVLQIIAKWSLDDLFGYLRSWSAVQECIKVTKTDPLLELDTELREAWDDVEQTKQVIWPLCIYAGEKPV